MLSYAALVTSNFLVLSLPLPERKDKLGACMQSLLAMLQNIEAIQAKRDLH